MAADYRRYGPTRRHVLRTPVISGRLRGPGPRDHRRPDESAGTVVHRREGERDLGGGAALATKRHLQWFRPLTAIDLVKETLGQRGVVGGGNECERLADRFAGGMAK